MPAGMFSNNTTIKINAAVTGSGTSGTIYTAPASGYAILNVRLSGSNQGITVGGIQTITNQAATSTPYTIYVGPSQAVAVTTDSTGSVQVTGVSFINSP